MIALELGLWNCPEWEILKKHELNHLINVVVCEKKMLGFEIYQSGKLGASAFTWALRLLRVERMGTALVPRP